MGAFTIYVLLRKQAFYLTEQKHWKKWIMAVVLLLETIFFLFDSYSFGCVAFY